MQVLGELPAGVYGLCVVPNTDVTGRQSYSGPILSCVALVHPGGTLGPLTVWDKAAAGEYDLLVLSGPQPSAIVSAEDAGPAPGLRVTVFVPSLPARSAALLVLLLVLLASMARRPGLRSSRRRASRTAPQELRQG